MSHQIFICAAPRDRIAANAVRAVLEADSIPCWIASRDLPAGADPDETARAAIAAAQVMVLIFSAKANEAQEQIKRELQFAAHSQTPVLPFRVENVKPVKVLEYFLPANQFMDAFSPPLDAHLRRLVAMLKPALEKAPARPPMAAPVPAAPPAQEPEPEQIASEPPAPVIEEPSTPEPASAPIPEAIEPQPDEPAAAEETSSPPQEPPPPPAPVLKDSPWFKKPLALALLAAVVIVLAGAGWWFLKPGPSAREQQAWSTASQQDAIPAYQAYLGAWPKGFFRDQATTHIAALKSQAEDAFAKAKAANTSAAYETFLASFAKQGVDVNEARAADDSIRAEEAKAKAAFDAAASAHTRESYKSFLADFGSSSYAAQARQNLAACHSETRNTTTVKTTLIPQSGSGSGGSSSEACEAAHDRAAAQAESSCRENQGQMGSVRVASQTPQQDGLQGGRILGSIFGAITGSRKESWKCTEEISASCQVSTSGVHQLDICP
jgi:hypothetical protein